MKIRVLQMISLRKRTTVMNQSASQYTQSLLNVLELHILRTHRKIWVEPAYYLMKTNSTIQLTHFLNLTIQRITKLLLSNVSLMTPGLL